MFKRTKVFAVNPQIKLVELTSRDKTLVRFPNGSLWSFDRRRIAMEEAIAEFDDLMFQFGRGRQRYRVIVTTKRTRLLLLRFKLWYL